MESLESKLDRLSPEQRKEAEDFVDFLLSRSGQVYRPLVITDAQIPIRDGSQPSLVSADQITLVHGAETRQGMMQDPSGSGDHAVPLISDEATPAPFREIDGGIRGWITHDYMDYGQFEQRPPPVTEAVKNFKRRLGAKEGQDKTHHLLDWVD